MEKKNNYIKKFTFADQVCERISYLNKVKDYLEKQLKNMPAGNLINLIIPTQLFIHMSR